MTQHVLMRLIFRTRYGKMDELVGLMKKNETMAATLGPAGVAADIHWRYLVDHGGDMFHVITELLTSLENITKWNEAVEQAYKQVEFQVWFNQMMLCTESGTREMWRVHVAPPNFANSVGRVMVRSVFQCRYGKADALVEHLGKESKLAQRQGIPPLAIYTDMAGPMFTVVASRDFDNLAGWEQTLKTTDALPEFSEWRRQLYSLVETGRREFYRIV